jgi:transcriptional regulator with GAF, ATPase, and Fis domain
VPTSGPSANPAFRMSVYLEGMVRRVIPLDQLPFTIGRVLENDLILEDTKVSTRHCQFLQKNGELWVEDLNSTNGIRINGVQAAAGPLTAGDRVEVGPFSLVIEAGDTPPEQTQTRTTEQGGTRDAVSLLLSLLESQDAAQPAAELLQSVLRCILTAVNGERVQLYRVDARSAECILAVSLDDSSRELPVSETLVLRVARTRHPLLINDTLNPAELAEPSLTRLAQAQIQSIILTPLMQGERLAGVLYVDSRASRCCFSRNELDLLTRTARYLTGVVEGLQVRTDLLLENRKLKEILGAATKQQVPLERLFMPGSPFENVVGMLQKAAVADVTVLLSGETGTGKEQAARTIHRLSPRSTGPFIAINCGAIPEGLVESELFGHRKGAFSGANQDRPGLIELAHRGVLFLDEVGELPLPVQVKMLRVLEERVVQRLGAGTTTAVDFRLIVATHQNLDRLVAKGTFRQDLMYRLKVFPILLPALRERAVDLPLLCEFLLALISRRTGKSVKTLAPETFAVLSSYDWPGNIRELRNVLERAVVFEDGDCLTPAALPLELLGLFEQRRPSVAPAGAVPTDDDDTLRPYAKELAAFERHYFRKLLKKAGNNVSAMARISGISRMTLYRKLAQINLLPSSSGDEDGQKGPGPDGE